VIVEPAGAVRAGQFVAHVPVHVLVSGVSFLKM
jgi:hypothetical protein